TPAPDFNALPFRSLYLLEDEFAAEVANRTMHGVMHIGRVSDGRGSCHAQMAVLVKPNGVLGTSYMTAIRPFRHLIVYPAILREGERAWRTTSSSSALRVTSTDHADPPTSRSIQEDENASVSKRNRSSRPGRRGSSALR